jgi:hypothetical protein
MATGIRNFYFTFIKQFFLAYDWDTAFAVVTRLGAGNTSFFLTTGVRDLPVFLSVHTDAELSNMR